MSATVIDRLRRRARPTKRDRAAQEARRAWETVRSGVADRADTLAGMAGDQLADAREMAAHQLADARKAAAPRLADARKATAHQLADARDAAAPQVRHLRDRAASVIDPVAEKVREELSDLTANAGRELSRLAVDVRDATRGEADRIIQAFHDSAEDARAEERRGRVRALIGWTVFGLVAGAVIAREYEQRRSLADVATPIPSGASIPPVLPDDEFDETAPTIV